MMNDIRNQLGKLTTTVGILQQERGKFPTQPQPNPQSTSNQTSQGVHFASSSVIFPEQAKAIISLRSGKVVDNQVKMPSDPILLSPPIDQSSPTILGESPKEASEEALEEREKEKGKAKESVPDPRVVPTPAPYPQRLKALAKPNLNAELHELFNQVKINIPLMDAVKQIPSYAKFLKDLCTRKRKLNVQKKIFLTEQVSSIIQTNIAPKYKDPGSPTIAITIGDKRIEQALLDLGASVNLLPFSVYQELGLGEMKQTRVTLQLADRSVRIPRGVVEDVLVQVGQFIYPVDFVILDTTPTDSCATSTPVILGRPFLATADAVINCRNGMLNMTFGNMKMEVNVFNLGSQMGDDESVNEVSFIDSLVEEHVDELLYSDPLEVALTAEEAKFLESCLYALLDEDEACALNAWTPKFKEFEELPSIEKKVLPSLVDPPLYDDPGGKPLTAKVVYCDDPLAKPLTAKEMDAEVDSLHSLLEKQDACEPSFEKLPIIEVIDFIGVDDFLVVYHPYIVDFVNNLKIDFVWAMHLVELKFLKRIRQLLYSKYFFLWHGRVQFLVKSVAWSALFLLIVINGVLNVHMCFSFVLCRVLC